LESTAIFRHAMRAATALLLLACVPPGALAAASGDGASADHAGAAYIVLAQGVPIVPQPQTEATREAVASTATDTDLSAETIDALVRAHAAYVEAGDAVSALQSAELLREYYEARYGEESHEALTWVKVHAYSFARLGQHRDAGRVFERAVALTERYEGPFSYNLVDLLMAQANTLLNLGESEAAESALLRAKFITHRRLGINNLDQVDVVRALSNLYLRTYSGEKSEREQQFLLRLYERNYGETPELVPGLYEHAGYYMDIGDYQSALPVYRRALEILEQAYGEDDLRLVEPLRGIANAHIKRASRRGEGERALERAVALYEQTEDTDVYDHALSLRELGDWHMRTSNSKAAIEAYSKAWALLARSDGNDQRARQLLGEPEYLDYIPPSNVYFSYQTRSFLSPDRYLETAFTVLPDGRVTDAVVVDSTAERRTEFDSLRALRAARFRPAFGDGEPISVAMTWRQYHSDTISN
jgi:tetratricopeptide (TPR) repeat protein